MSDTKQTITAKLVGFAATFAAAWVAQKIIDTSWTKATGHKPPKPEDDEDSRLSELAVAAVVSGAVIALSRVLAMRGAARIVG